jgi:hypothetical protein
MATIYNVAHFLIFVVATLYSVAHSLIFKKLPGFEPRAEVASRRTVNFATTFLFYLLVSFLATRFPTCPPSYLLGPPPQLPLPGHPSSNLPIQLPTWSAAPGLPTWPPVFLLAHPAPYLERPVSTSPLCFLHATKHLTWSPTWGHQYPCWGHPSPYLVPRLGSLFRATNLPYLEAINLPTLEATNLPTWGHPSPYLATRLSIWPSVARNNY